MSGQPGLGEICWNELGTANVEGAKKFYANVFGWEFTDHDIGDMTYTLIKKNGKDCGGIWAIPSDKQKEMSPQWLTYIHVANVEDSLKKAQEQGATIIRPVTPVSDYGKFGVICDPTGAVIALWETVKACQESCC